MYSLEDFKGYGLKGVLKRIVKTGIEDLRGAIVYDDNLHKDLLDIYANKEETLFGHYRENVLFIKKYIDDFYKIYEEVDLDIDEYWGLDAKSIFEEPTKYVYATVEALIGVILEDFNVVVENVYGFSDEVQVDDIYVKLFNAYIDNYDFSRVGLA